MVKDLVELGEGCVLLYVWDIAARNRLRNAGNVERTNVQRVFGSSVEYKEEVKPDVGSIHR